MEQNPHLKMWYSNLAQLPVLELPCGYTLKRWQAGDELAWVQVLQTNGELGEWSLERAQRAFGLEEGRVWPESIHFVVHNNVPVATACVQLHNSTLDVPELGWVAVVPGHRGHKLGRVVSLAVMHFMQQAGYRCCYLKTNDWRIAAIKTYLALGFVPDLTHESYQARWEAIYQSLQSTNSTSA